MARLTAEQSEALLAALPEWSPLTDGPPLAIRARYLLQYETGLRAASLQRLRTPKHYARGDSEIRLSPDIERARRHRAVPLSARSREALDHVLERLGPEHNGPIFGVHDFKRQVKRAVRLALPENVADEFRELDIRPCTVANSTPLPTFANDGWTLRELAGGTWVAVFQSGERECTRSTGTKDRAQALEFGARIYAEANAALIERPAERYRALIESSRDDRIAAIKLNRLAAALSALRAQVEDETRKAERIYAERYGTNPLPPELQAQPSRFPTFARASDLWISEFRTTHARVTLEVWDMYARNLWPGYFSDLERITHVALKEYMRSRLGVVRRESVRKELFALSSFLQFCAETFELPHVELPKLPKRALGVQFVKRRRKAASELAPEQVRALLRELPEWGSTSHLDAEQYAVRARFLILYETGLRPSTIDRLRVPEHYAIGQRVLHLTPEVDKARFGRDVPLTKRARRILDYLVRKLGPDLHGPIFGTADGAAHDYRKRLQRAAFKALPREVAATFCGAHLRSARITHLLEKGANIVGVQHLAGHKQISTTARYVRAGFRAATDAISVWEGRA